MAGPSERAGFIDAPQIGAANIASNPNDKKSNAVYTSRLFPITFRYGFQARSGRSFAGRFSDVVASGSIHAESADGRHGFDETNGRHLPGDDESEKAMLPDVISVSALFGVLMLVPFNTDAKSL